MNKILKRTIMPIRSCLAYNSLVKKHNEILRKATNCDENRRHMRVEIDNLQEEKGRLDRKNKTACSTFQKKINGLEVNVEELTKELAAAKKSKPSPKRAPVKRNPKKKKK